MNTVKANFNDMNSTRTLSLYQYDYGQILKFEGLTLPESYEVHFANDERGESVTQIGSAEGVAIPDALLETGKPVYAWVFLHTGEYDGETEYKAIIPVKRRAQPSDDQPEEVEQSEVTQAIAELIERIRQTGSNVAAAQTAATEAAGSAERSAEQAVNAVDSATEAETEAANAANYGLSAEGSAAEAAQQAAAAENSATAAQASAQDAAQQATSAAANAAEAQATAESMVNKPGFMSFRLADGELIMDRVEATKARFQLIDGDLYMDE